MQWTFVYNNCKVLESRDTSSRFGSLYSLDESKTTYRRFEIQMCRSYKGLERMDKMPSITDMEEDARL